jgi:hypothetical protein
MKNLILPLVIIAFAMVAASCKKDENKVIKTYEMRVGLGTDNYVGSESPGLNYCVSETEKAIDNLNATLKDPITVTGVSEEDVEEKAIAEFDRRAEQVYIALINIKLKFETNRQLEAEKIKTEIDSNGKPYYVKLTAQLFLEEAEHDILESPKIIMRSDTYIMEAKGGEDYSL